MPKLDNNIIDKIKILYETEYLIAVQIANKINIHPDTVRNYIKKLNMSQIFDGDVWVSIPNYENYKFNLKDNRIVKIGYGEIKHILHKNDGYYTIKLNGKKYRLHRIIFACHHGYFPEYIDHIDGDKLNNNIENLRECTKSQNTYNSKLMCTNTSGYKGVSFIKEIKKYRVNMMINGKQKHLGYFENPIEAAKGYDKAAIEYHGEFAKTNKMLGFIQ